jgi:DNA-binding sugar fermentation-stimulating protein
LSPNGASDPVFTEALRCALLKGVEVDTYDSRVTLEGISINRRVPVKI